MPASLENSAVATGLEDVNFYPKPKEGQCQRMLQLSSWHGYAQNTSSKASTVHEPRISRCPSRVLKRQRNQRSNCQHPLGHRKQKSSRETSTSALLTTPKPLPVWITANCRKFWKRWEYHTTLPASWDTCMQVKKQQLEPDMEQWTGSKWGKEYVKAVYCHPAYLTYM